MVKERSHYHNLYNFYWDEKIYALAKASHPRTTATADPTGSSRLFTDPEEKREGKRSQFYSCRPWIISLAPISSNACRALYGYAERYTTSIIFAFNSIIYDFINWYLKPNLFLFSIYFNVTLTVYVKKKLKIIIFVA